MTSHSSFITLSRTVPHFRTRGREICHNALQSLRDLHALIWISPSLIASGAITLLVSAMMHMMPAGPDPRFLHGWMEDWIVTWAIGFPLTWLVQMAIAWLGETRRR